MFKVKYSEEAFVNIDNFINSYKSIFKKIYSDTGIYDEDLIIRNYIEIGDRLYKNIKESIEKKFKEKVVLGIVTNEEKNENYMTISINHFRLFVYYSENIDFKERYIENIEFFKK